MRLLRLWLPLVAGCLLATACSLARFGYDFAPAWASWEIDKFLDLEHSQKEIVHRRLDELRDWHRRAQLPRYVDVLRELERETARPMPAARITHLRVELTAEAWPPLVGRIAPGMAELLLTLRPSQVAHLRREMADANRKWLKEQLHGGNREAAIKARVGRMQERAEFFLGSLDRDQKRLLRDQTAELPTNDDARYAEREVRQKRLLALIERVIAERPGQAQAEQWCEAWLRDLWQATDPERKARLEATSLAADELMAKVLASASDAQRKHMAGKIDGFATQFAKVAAAP